MKILAVSPPARFSVWDVYKGQVAGLRANGAKVYEFDYGERLNLFNEFYQWCKRHNKTLATAGEKVYISAGESIYVTARALEVDLVWLNSPLLVHSLILRLLKRDGIRTAGYMSECPYEDETWTKLAPLYDYCFINDKVSLPLWRQTNPHTFYLPHSFDPERHHPDGDAPKEFDVMFIGTGFPTRRRFFEKVDWDGINPKFLGYWPNTPARAPIRRWLDFRIVNNAETVSLYQRSRIGLQLHRQDKSYWEKGVITPDSAYSIGPRSYELAACGVFQLSDERPELREVFGDSVPTFRTPAELGDLIRYYLAHEGEREEMAMRQRESVQLCTFTNRMRDVLDVVAA
jgi:spore maturation protein CgeB